MSTKKKFVIKPFRPNAQMDEFQADKIWNALRDAIREIHNQNASSLSFEELYRNAYNLVLHKHGEKLYKGVRQTVEEHLEGVATRVAQTVDAELLQEIDRQWREHKITMVMIRDILMYMDRTHVVQNKRTPVYDMGLRIFRECIARHAMVKTRLQEILLANIQREREGELIDRLLMKNTLSMLVELGVKSRNVYEQDFERCFLEATALFYRQESQQFLSQNNCPQFLRKAESRLHEEQERVTHYLDSSTDHALKQCIERELIREHAAALVELENSGCTSMFRDDKLQDLQRMYGLFSRVPATLEFMRQSLFDYVKESGKTLVTDQERVKDPVAFVRGLLDMRDKYERIVRASFSNDKTFQKTITNAFETFINLDSRCAQYLSLYIDEMLKSGFRGLSEEDVETRLQKVIVIFRYLQDKDVFENFYKKYLAKRLLGKRSVSDDAERSMIAKLKAECGYQFTSKLEGMFTDMRMSKQANETFQKASAADEAAIDLSVHVLTTGFWPAQGAPSCQLPPPVLERCAAFEKFYLNIHTGRKLSWQANMGNADLKANFDGRKRHELNVSTYQMCILMLFNTTDSLTVGEIQESTNIPLPDLKRHLISMANARYRVLRKPKGRDVQLSSVITFNPDFKSKLFRVRIPLISQKTTAQPTIPQPVEEDRRHLIEAAVVRIMKTRKKMEHSNLMVEVTKQLSSRFVPSPPLIKKRIESLIEREYLERSPQDRRMYHYLA